jgi:hypothetical protein
MGCTSPYFLQFSTKSSISTKEKRVLTVYSSEKNEDAVKKGSGNVRKHGSGGNSYYAYLSKKIGKTYVGKGYNREPKCSCD